MKLILALLGWFVLSMACYGVTQFSLARHERMDAVTLWQAVFLGAAGTIFFSLIILLFVWMHDARARVFQFTWLPKVMWGVWILAFVFFLILGMG